MYQRNANKGAEYARAEADSITGVMATAAIRKSIADDGPNSVDLARSQMRIYGDFLDPKERNKLEKEIDAKASDFRIANGVQELRDATPEKRQEVLDAMENREEAKEIQDDLDEHDKRVKSAKMQDYKDMRKEEIAKLISSPGSYIAQINKNRKKWALKFNDKDAPYMLKLLKELQTDGPAEYPKFSDDAFLAQWYNKENIKKLPFIDLLEAKRNGLLSYKHYQEFLKAQGGMNVEPDVLQGRLSKFFDKSIAKPRISGDSEENILEKRDYNSAARDLFYKLARQYDDDDLKKYDTFEKIRKKMVQTVSFDREGDRKPWDIKDSYAQYAKENPYSVVLPSKKGVKVLERKIKAEPTVKPEMPKGATNTKWVDRYYPQLGVTVTGWTFKDASGNYMIRDLNGQDYNLTNINRKARRAGRRRR